MRGQWRRQPQGRPTAARELMTNALSLSAQLAKSALGGEPCHAPLTTPGYVPNGPRTGQDSNARACSVAPASLLILRCFEWRQASRQRSLSASIAHGVGDRVGDNAHTSADGGGGRSNERFRLTESVLHVDQPGSLWLAAGSATTEVQPVFETAFTVAERGARR
jgi:hypothetical protein